MMLHRHFDPEKSNNMTTLTDVSRVNEGADIGIDVSPSTEGEKPKRGRKKKTEE